jgi:hypothetical protein
MNKFVFVVCGGKEHIEELNFSLKFLSHYSKNEILVLTDSKRNEIEIEYDNIIEIETPEHYTNHQASIFIKTGLYKFLDASHNYCYLDGDVVAVSPTVDSIFSKFSPPVTFAADHCPICEFSPHAMNCGCLIEQTRIEHEKKESLKLKLAQIFGKVDFSNDKVKKQSDELLELFSKWRRNPFLYFLQNINYLSKRYVFPIKYFKINDYTFNRTNKCWYNAEKELILFDYPYYEKKLWVESGIRFNKNEQYWEDRDGTIYIFKTPSCSHLTDYIGKQYGIDIPENWRHWNGGVFLFNKESHDFLAYWHKTTLMEFENPYTLTRDQGTLALSVWKFKLEDHVRLPREYNFIAEFENSDIGFTSDWGYTADNFKTRLEPSFLHVYHEWGRHGWSIWDSIVGLGKRENLF